MRPWGWFLARVGVWLLWMAALAGCSADEPWYDVGMHNAYDESLKDVHWVFVSAGREWDMPGKSSLDRGNSATVGPGYRPMPELARLWWIDAAGQPQWVEFSPQAAMPNHERFDGTLWFIWRGPELSWAMVPFSDAERGRRAGLAARDKLPPGSNPLIPPPDWYLPSEHLSSTLPGAGRGRFIHASRTRDLLLTNAGEGILPPDPPLPSRLTFTADGPDAQGRVRFDWTYDGLEPRFFEIEMMHVGHGNFRTIATPTFNQRTYTHAHLDPTGTYRFRFRARLIDGSGSPYVAPSP